MSLDAELIGEPAEQNRPSNQFLRESEAERLAETLKPESENKPDKHEWQSTPMRPFDYTSEGYGVIWLKDEGANPNGSAKDRPVWEAHVAVGDSLRARYLQNGEFRQDDGSPLIMQPFTAISSGNYAYALAQQSQDHGLPPPRIIIDHNLPEERKAKLQNERLFLYETDLSQQALKGEHMLALTDNEHGIALTATNVPDPERLFYDWQTREVFNHAVNGDGFDNICVPVGSHCLFENYLTTQRDTMKEDQKDPRLYNTTVADVISANIIGATASNPSSQADKLTAQFNPFTAYSDLDIRDFKQLGYTGDQTGIYSLDDHYFAKAQQMLADKGHITSPSGAAGLAGYIAGVDNNIIDPRATNAVVDTGGTPMMLSDNQL